MAATAELRGGGGTDRISALPDDLLHAILLRLPSTRAAGRTAVLSRRWRHVWAHLPALYLYGIRPLLPASCVSIVDGALAAYSAQSLAGCLVILPDDTNLVREGVTAAHAGGWLRFPSRRVAGEIYLWLPADPFPFASAEQGLDLPVCAAARSVSIRLRPPPPPVAGGGVFAVLTCLAIHNGVMDSGELGALVSSSRCPCLEKLSLTVSLAAAGAGADADVTIRSDSLKRLEFHVGNTRRVVVATPALWELCASKAAEAHIAAPSLAVVEHRYAMDRYEFAGAGRHLQRLVVNLRFPLPEIMGRFDTKIKRAGNRGIPEIREGHWQA